eukprot:TRINITY_DN5211_c2_g1_i4.p1 TRINITY_DN5211_c2_g1~~TRINITY_DN5211_c2_g1_i4.p1  ORF type:complete len:107 (-),score=3.07 TRINITY_DN5211_c2_g1_i4:917-1216(-)
MRFGTSMQALTLGPASAGIRAKIHIAPIHLRSPIEAYPSTHPQILNRRPHYPSSHPQILNRRPHYPSSRCLTTLIPIRTKPSFPNPSPSPSPASTTLES